MNVRAIAAQALGQVLGEGRSLAVVLPPALARVAPHDRGLLRELCYGVCRWQPELQVLLDGLLNRPLDPREPMVRALLLVGLYQLHHLRIPDHAAVAETVAAARQVRKPWAASLTNAVLRSFPRRRAELLARVEADTAARTAHPTTGRPSSPPTTPAPPLLCELTYSRTVVTPIRRGWRRWVSTPNRWRWRQRR